jgi:hypothetical protein
MPKCKVYSIIIYCYCTLIGQFIKDSMLALFRVRDM